MSRLLFARLLDVLSGRASESQGKVAFNRRCLRRRCRLVAVNTSLSCLLSRSILTASPTVRLDVKCIQAVGVDVTRTPTPAAAAFFYHVKRSGLMPTRPPDAFFVTPVVRPLEKSPRHRSPVPMDIPVRGSGRGNQHSGKVNNYRAAGSVA